MQGTALDSVVLLLYGFQVNKDIGLILIIKNFHPSLPNVLYTCRLNIDITTF